ncbi:DUF692 family multinuclear iron-containing protein [Arenicella xantha]|uniref:Putative DNA-binding domain-containing protein n=1 Tax=Arenicella xantha TaxID=644221 RepID=A0A395JG45_9GAMM|nr:DUF692 family multinuclear iron-containing protein [Arenicella xantha]RBP48691.1 hypothetical protein DFR28_10529 [Arenicella xantha]
MKSGLGIRSELFQQVAHTKPDFGFLEAHSENYFGASLLRAKLLDLREQYPISLHGVGLSLGRADKLSVAHLNALKSLVDDIQPTFVSEHLAWSAYQHHHVPDLLPLPLTPESLTIMCEHIDQMQSFLGRQILIENPSNYLLFDQLQIPEADFLNHLASTTGCGLLVDINNVYVSAQNLDRDPMKFINDLSSAAIHQYHLAGHTPVVYQTEAGQEELLIDTHNQPVSAAAWGLFEKTLARHGSRPTLIEWDSDFPAFDVLLNECEQANQRLANASPIVKTQSATHQHSGSGANNLPLAQQQQQFLNNILGSESDLAEIQAAHQSRIRIYRNNVSGALHRYLADIYPATEGVVGHDYFRQIVQLATQSTPPTDGNIHNYGGDLATVLDEFEGLDQKLPYLTDLMAFEWALHSVYFQEQSTELDPSSISQDALLTEPIAFRKDARMMVSDYPIYQIHRQSLPGFVGEVSIRLDQSQDALLIYKQNHAVESWLLDSASTVLLTAIQDSNSLLQAISAVEGVIPPTQLSSALAQILERRILVITSEDMAD